MKIVSRFLFLTCQKATGYVERNHQRDLGLVDQWKLRLHFKLCKVCAEYSYQSRWIEKLIQDQLRKEEENPISEAEVEIIRLKVLKGLEIG